MREKWRVVPSEPRYQVSNLGRVRGPRGKLLKLFPQPNGYFEITVDSSRYKNGKRVPRRRSISSMVLEAFVGPRPSSRHLSRHLNDNKADNKLINLEWGTAKDNAIDRSRNGSTYRPTGELHHMAKVTDDQVRQLRRVYRRYGKEHIALAKSFGITGWTARYIGSGNGWPHVK